MRKEGRLTINTMTIGLDDSFDNILQIDGQTTVGRREEVVPSFCTYLSEIHARQLIKYLQEFVETQEKE